MSSKRNLTQICSKMCDLFFVCFCHWWWFHTSLSPVSDDFWSLYCSYLFVTSYILKVSEVGSRRTWFDVGEIWWKCNWFQIESFHSCSKMCCCSDLVSQSSVLDRHIGEVSHIWLEYAFLTGWKTTMNESLEIIELSTDDFWLCASNWLLM